MANRMKSCPCPLRLPHCDDQASFAGRTMPTYFANEEASELWQMEAADLIDHVTAKVDNTHARTDDLRNRIGDLEKVAKDIATGAIVHDEDCAHTKRFIGTMEPRPPTRENPYKIHIRELEGKLKQANGQLVRLRNEKLKLRDENRTLKAVLDKELGPSESSANAEELLTRIGWKGRAQIIDNLKTKVGNLEAKLHRLQSGEQVSEDEIFPYEPYNVVSRKQRKVMDNHYSDKREILIRKDRQLKQLNDEYLSLEKVNKSSMSRINTLSGEVKDLKRKAQYLEDKAKSDEKVIRTLMDHQKVLRAMLDRDNIMNKQAFQRESDLNELMGLGIVKCLGKLNSDELLGRETKNAILRVTYNVNNSFDRFMEIQKRLDTVILQLIEAEKHCCNHQCRIQELQTECTRLKRSGKFQEKQTTNFPKSSTQVSYEEQLKLVRKENDFLRSFLRDAVVSKADDFNIYKANLDSVERIYLTSVQKIRNCLSIAALDDGQRADAKELEKDEGNEIKPSA